MRVFLITLSMSFLLIFSPARATETRNFGDWYVSCEEYGECVAAPHETYPAKWPELTLSIVRQNYSDDWEISLNTYGGNLVKYGTIDFDFGDKKISFSSTPDSAAQEFAAYDGLHQYYLLGPKAQNLFDLLAPASEVNVSFLDAEGYHLGTNVSLKGLTASLLWIDDFQERLGSPRTTGKPPNDRTLVTNRIAEEMSDEILKLHAQTPECEPLEDLNAYMEVKSYRLDAENSLHLLPCYAGAYNFIYTAWVQKENWVERQLFASYSEYIGWTGTMFLTTPDFNERFGMLTDFNRGRGIGDCGMTRVWKWKGWGFKLLELTEKPECDGLGEPGEFPIIYKAPEYKPSTR